MGGKKGKTPGKVSEGENQENACESNIVKEPALGVSVQKPDNKPIRAASPCTSATLTLNAFKKIINH